MNEKHRTRPRILLADDHAVVVEGICAILEKTYEVVGIAKDGRELLTKAAQLKPDLIIVDVGMPSLNGFDAAQQVLKALPKVKLSFVR